MHPSLDEPVLYELAEPLLNQHFLRDARYTRFELGGPEVLEVAERSTPSPGRGQVLVRVDAIGLNSVT